MKVATQISSVTEEVRAWKDSGLSIGLVPTMGALHDGHKSLIERCRKENDKVIVSVFVNPIQFGPNEDFEQYPRPFEKDKEICEALGADLVFHPDPSEMYQDLRTFVTIEGLTDNLCGVSRPTHFRGVCTVVSKLFNITKAERAYFGQKDAQQLAIIRKMVKDLNFDVEIKGCPIVRESDGLAKSSRNKYLNEEERKAALCLSKSLKLAMESISPGMKASELIDIIRSEIEKEPLSRIDYASCVDALTMEDVETIDRDVLIAIAVYIGKTRLIDNFSYEIKE